MYLISENYKRKRNGRGTYICNVFYVNNLKSQPTDLSDQIAEKFNLKYKDGSIEIPHGSGTGVMVLTSLLKKGQKNYPVFDVSVFNQ